MNKRCPISGSAMISDSSVPIPVTQTAFAQRTERENKIKNCSMFKTVNSD
jgi:hypothetical protein